MKLNKELYSKMVKCIDNIPRSYKHCIGYCHNDCHKGFITKKLLDQHKCLEKKCIFMDPIKEHEYWIYEKKRNEKRMAIKNNKKKIKETEKLIISRTSELYPNIEIVMCKYLYENLYFLITLQSDGLVTLSKQYLDSLGVKLFIKQIEASKQKNIKYTYRSLLPTKIRERIRK